MPTRWIRVQNTRTGEILPNSVPESFLIKFKYLRETPSSRKAAEITEPVQPAANVPEITEPATPANSGRTITEPAKPEKK